jgi:outer membrane protein TolC
MNSIRYLGLLLAATLAVSVSAEAQEQINRPRMEASPRRKASLREALQLAARQGPDVAAARAQAQVVAAGVNKAWTAWQPDITATGTFDHTDAFSSIDLSPLGRVLHRLDPSVPADQFGTGPISILKQNNYFATFQLVQPLLTPQGLFAPGIAKAGAEAAERGADEAREQVLLGVARAYLGLQGLEGLLEAARDAEKVALSREKDARARISAGTDVEIGLLRAQTETAQARSQIAALQGQKESLLPLLEALTGEAIEPQGESAAEDLGPASSDSDPWEGAFSVKSAAAATVAAQRATRLDRFTWLPTVSGIAKENYNSNEGFSGKHWTYDLMINVSVPLYDRGTRYANMHENDARLAQAQAQLAASRAKARAAWIGAKANLAAARAVLEQTNSQAQLAARAQAQVDVAARAGVATSLDLSDADQKKFAAQSAAAQARAELAVRRAEIAAAEGRLFALAAAQ